MIAQNASIGPAIGSAIYLAAFYGICFRRILRSNSGNKLVESGIATLIVFMTMLPISKIQGFPDWVPDWAFALWIILVVLLCFLTLFFLAQRIFRTMFQRSKG